MAPLIQLDCDLSLLSQEDTSPFHDRKIPPERRNVSFAPVVKFRLVRSRVDYRPEEIKACWYDDNEHEEIALTAQVEAELVETGILGETENFTNRGLECRTRKGMKKRRHSRDEAYYAVFQELFFQQEEQYFSEEIISYVYFECSESCAKQAQMQAKRDEVEALKIYEEN